MDNQAVIADSKNGDKLHPLAVDGDPDLAWFMPRVPRRIQRLIGAQIQQSKKDDFLLDKHGNKKPLRLLNDEFTCNCAFFFFSYNALCSHIWLRHQQLKVLTREHFERWIWQFEEDNDSGIVFFDRASTPYNTALAHQDVDGAPTSHRLEVCAITEQIEQAMYDKEEELERRGASHKERVGEMKEFSNILHSPTGAIRRRAAKEWFQERYGQALPPADKSAPVAVSASTPSTATTAGTECQNKVSEEPIRPVSLTLGRPKGSKNKKQSQR